MLNTGNGDILQSTQNTSYGSMLKSSNENYDFQWKNNKFNNHGISYKIIAEFLCDYYERDKIVFCTEYVGGNKRYQCHPKYCNNGPYYDWMLVLYYDGKNYPCKLIPVIPPEHNVFEGYQLVILKRRLSFIPRLSTIP